ncbi:MAG: energy-coupling factor transporter ATPase [Clostridia bacterium]|nr:energy-coupling factor transporter ATPase [Clostridia bacterium]
MPIVVKNLSFTYMEKSPYEKKALDDVSIQIDEGEFLAVIGHTGSGKSTFIQHLNGLIKLKNGNIKVFDIDLNAKKPDLRRLRCEVGMVFQYPEYQLFDETVAKDVGFGPRNMKLSTEEVDRRVRKAIELVGLDYDEVAERSPFELSGGQKRRVAIAGVIAMEPKVLVLDEPIAGLDPRGKNEIMKLIIRLKNTISPTIIMVSHDMDNVARYATRVAVFENAKLLYSLPPDELFANSGELSRIGLDVPVAVKLANALRAKGVDIKSAITPESLVEEILRVKGGNNA